MVKLVHAVALLVVSTAGASPAFASETAVAKVETSAAVVTSAQPARPNFIEEMQQPATCTTAPDSTFSQWRKGDEFVRKATINDIAKKGRDLRRMATPPEPADIVALQESVDALQSCYDARAGRQQTWLGLGTGLVVLGTTGAVLSSGAGATTQGYWAAAGLAPGVISQFNAYEPTRDLFHSGAELLGYLSLRQRAVSQWMKTATEGKTPAETWAGTACDNLSDVARNAAVWDEADRTAIMPEVDRLQSACDAVKLNEAIYSVLEERKKENGALLIDYVDNVLELDRQLGIQDRGLRYTPLQAISALAASPFLAVGSILSSEDNKNAVEALKSAKAISSLKVQLDGGPEWIGAKPFTAPAPIGAAARARASVKRPEAAKKAQEDISTAIAKLTAAQRALANAAPIYETRIRSSEWLRLASKGGVLGAQFDPNSRTVQVTIAEATRTIILAN